MQELIQLRANAQGSAKAPELDEALRPSSITEPEKSAPPQPKADSPVTGGIFISYRREETDAYAGRLYDRLSSRFGEERVFMDIDSIPLGDDFVDVITNKVESCDVLLALIGKW